MKETVYTRLLDKLCDLVDLGFDSDVESTPPSDSKVEMSVKDFIRALQDVIRKEKENESF